MQGEGDGSCSSLHPEDVATPEKVTVENGLNLFSLKSGPSDSGVSLVTQSLLTDDALKFYRKRDKKCVPSSYFQAASPAS